MSKTCSIFIDNISPIDNRIISYLNNKYDSIVLVGSSMTTKYHPKLPYIYYNYIRYYDNIDIIFQNLKDILKLGITNHKIGYIYDCTKHNSDYNLVASLLKKVDVMLVEDKQIPMQLFADTFEYTKEVIYV